MQYSIFIETVIVQNGSSEVESISIQRNSREMIAKGQGEVCKNVEKLLMSITIKHIKNNSQNQKTKPSPED